MSKDEQRHIVEMAKVREAMPIKYEDLPDSIKGATYPKMSSGFVNIIGDQHISHIANLLEGYADVYAIHESCVNENLAMRVILRDVLNLGRNLFPVELIGRIKTVLGYDGSTEV